MGLYDLITETTPSNLNSFLQRYNTDSALGITLTTTLENLQLELGSGSAPFTMTTTYGEESQQIPGLSPYGGNDKLGREIDMVYENTPLPREKYV